MSKHQQLSKKKWYNALGKHLKDHRTKYTAKQWMNILLKIRKEGDVRTSEDIKTYDENPYKKWHNLKMVTMLSMSAVARLTGAAAVSYFDERINNKLVNITCQADVRGPRLSYKFMMGDLLVERVVFYTEDIVYSPEDCWLKLQARMRILAIELQRRYEDTVRIQEHMKLRKDRNG